MPTCHARPAWTYCALAGCAGAACSSCSRAGSSRATSRATTPPMLHPTRATSRPVSSAMATTRSIVRSLRIPRARIRLGSGDPPRYVADEGRPGVATVAWPMIRGDRVLGTLEVSPRHLGGSFTAAEQTLLAEVARQAATAAEAETLSFSRQSTSTRC